MKRCWFCLLVVCVALAAGPLVSAANRQKPELPDGLVWFNTAKPVELSAVNDHFTLLHFGIYSASNADLAMSDLQALAAKYPGQLVVIGVHAAKFFNASGFDDIRQSVQAQNVRYPVAIDAHLTAFEAFHIDALPTIILIAPDGKVLLRKTGGDIFRFVDQTLNRRLGSYKNSLSGTPADFTAQPQLTPAPHASPSPSTTPGPAAPTPLPTATATLAAAVDHSPATATWSPSQTVPPSFELADFVGQRIKIDREYSRDIGKVTLAIGLDDRTPLNPAVKSYVKIFTKERELIGGLETPQPNAEIPIDRRINSDGLYVELSYYYIRDGLTYFKGVLFEVPLGDYSKPENILIRHHLTNF